GALAGGGLSQIPCVRCEKRDQLHLLLRWRAETHQRVPLQVLVVAAGRPEGAEIAVTLDPRLVGARGRTAVERDPLLRSTPAGARDIRGLPEPRFAAVHPGLRL